MKYIKKDLGSFNLHMIKVDKFKTIKMRVMFRNKIKKDEITIRNFLINILTLSSKKYETKRRLAIEAQDLYAAQVSSYNRRIGSYITTNISLAILNEKYTEKGMLEKSINFLREIIFNPNVENKKFDSKSFEIVKKDMEMMFESLKEDYSKYSMIRLSDEIDPEAPYSYRTVGYEEDLEKINEETLYQYYKNMISNDKVDIYIIGDIDFLEVERIIKANFNFRTLKKDNKLDALINCVSSPKKVKEIKEQEDINQAKLAIACKLVDLTDYERKYPLTLYHLIFGGSSDSKLFQVIREKHSLAYTISSALSKMDSLLFINGGIAKENYKKTIDLINEQLKAMAKGDFNEEDIDKAKQIYLTAIENMEDSLGQIVNNYVMMDLTNSDDINTKKEMMGKVTKEEIIEVSKKVKMDTIYFLEGEM